MERHGKGDHVYSLPSSRHRKSTSASATAPASPNLLPSQPPTKYTPSDWHILSLKRSSTAPRSAPNSPSNQHAPPSASPQPSSYLIVTLLHIPTQVIYGWPIALSGNSSGKCMVTQPYATPPGAEMYRPQRVLSESVKILADVIQAWIKTSPMREALRRKESKREKGARKIGENEQDAIWLNDGLSLAKVDNATRQDALQRSLLEHGEPTSPPSQSPATSPRPSISGASGGGRRESISSVFAEQGSPIPPTSMAAAAEALTGTSTPESITRPETPRIEISAPDFFASSPVVTSTASPGVLQHAIERVDKQQDAVEAEIAQWMSKATLSDFTRPRPPSIPGSPRGAMMVSSSSSSTSSPTSSPSMSPLSSPTPGFSSSAPPSRTSSPVYFKSGSLPRKTVTFSDSAAIASAAPTTARPWPAYFPAFAPHVQLSPCVSEEDVSSQDTIVGRSSASSAPTTPSTPTKSSMPTPAPLSMPPPILAPTPVSPRSSGLANSSPIARTSTNSSTKSLPAPVLSPTLSPSSSTPPPLSRASHSQARSRTSSKLSQEVSPEELSGVLKASSRSHNKSSSSPVHSFSDLKQALRVSFKPKAAKSKVSAA